MENKIPDSLHPKAKKEHIQSSNKKGSIAQYVIFVVVFTILIGIFSLFMVAVASYRSYVVDTSNYTETSGVYNGPVSQRAPELGLLSTSSKLYLENNLTPAKLKMYIDNTALVSTDGLVTIQADFVKKGLSYQPSYKTQFYAIYYLENFLDEESLIAFNFPFPFQSNSQEISNAKLIVNGSEVPDSKTKLNLSYSTETGGVPTNRLHWEGKIPGKGQVKVEVSYDTVGLSSFAYLGLENSKKSQDFKFAL